MGVVSSHHGFGNLLCSHRQLIQSQIFSVFCGVGLGAGDKVRNSADMPLPLGSWSPDHRRVHTVQCGEVRAV